MYSSKLLDFLWPLSTKSSRTFQDLESRRWLIKRAAASLHKNEKGSSRHKVRKRLGTFQAAHLRYTECFFFFVNAYAPLPCNLLTPSSNVNSCYRPLFTLWSVSSIYTGLRIKEVTPCLITKRIFNSFSFQRKKKLAKMRLSFLNLRYQGVLLDKLLFSRYLKLGILSINVFPSIIRIFLSSRKIIDIFWIALEAIKIK